MAAKDPPKMQVGEQAGALGVPQKVHTQKSTGKPVTASLDAYGKLLKVNLLFHYGGGNVKPHE